MHKFTFVNTVASYVFSLVKVDIVLSLKTLKSTGKNYYYNLSLFTLMFAITILYTNY